MHQVGLAQADAAIKEQRVEGDRAAFGHAAGGGMGQFVGLADDEAVKGEAGVKRGTGQVFVIAGAGCLGGSARRFGFDSGDGTGHSRARGHEKFERGQRDGPRRSAR